MLTIESKKIKDPEGVETLVPETEIPHGYKVRFVNGQYQAIPQNEEFEQQEVPK